MPVFDGCTHNSVTWVEFQIVAGILHIGSTLVNGHYQAILFKSGAGLPWDDNRNPTKLVRDPSFYQNIYLLWLAPMQEIRNEYRRPLPQTMIAQLGALISEHLT